MDIQAKDTAGLRGDGAGGQRGEITPMDFRAFGNQSGKTLLLPGTACTWQLNFKNEVDDLAAKYHIIAVNYDGTSATRISTSST